MFVVIVVLIILWLFGFISDIAGSFIHLLLLLAGILYIVDYINNKE
jgi:hypothetical protein